MKVNIETDQHLQNLVRHVRERLMANNPVQAFICLGDLENYLHGKNMDGNAINHKQCICKRVQGYNKEDVTICAKHLQEMAKQK